MLKLGAQVIDCGIQAMTEFRSILDGNRRPGGQIEKAGILTSKARKLHLNPKGPSPPKRQGSTHIFVMITFCDAFSINHFLTQTHSKIASITMSTGLFRKCLHLVVCAALLSLCLAKEEVQAVSTKLEVKTGERLSCLKYCFETSTQE